MNRQLTLLMLTVLIIAAPVGGQNLMNRTLPLSNVSLHQQGDSLYISMAIDMRNLAVDSKRSLTLTPLLTDNAHNIALQEITINGHSRHKAYLRGMAIKRQTPSAIVIPYRQRGVLTYRKAVAYQPWMENASLKLDENLCGCGGHKEVVSQELITDQISTVNKRLSSIIPAVAFIQPTAEAVKKRSEYHEAHLDFPVNQAVIRAEYMNNQAELARINTWFDQLENDRNLTVTEVQITGLASPEGTLSHNEQLAKKRAEALKEYLIARKKVPAGQYKVTFGGENWDGLVEALNASDLPGKQNLLNIIDQTSDNVLRKQQLMRAEGGSLYRTLIKDIYPGLRKVNCLIDYTVNPFNVDQAKAAIVTNPKHLSLNEMYLVANSYSKGSPEFTDVFDAAVRMFPNDPTANLNAAAAELSQKRAESAFRYLEKADRHTAEYLNNFGVYHFQKGDVSQAITLFQQAAQMGNETARQNWQALTDAWEYKGK